jgi:hypothetical protein
MTNVMKTDAKWTNEEKKKRLDELRRQVCGSENPKKLNEALFVNFLNSDYQDYDLKHTANLLVNLLNNKTRATWDSEIS